MATDAQPMADIAQERKQQIVNILRPFIESKWTKHYAGVDYVDNGPIRAWVFLEIAPATAHFSQASDGQPLDNLQLNNSEFLPGDDVQGKAESVDPENIVHKTDTETLIDCLIEALFLALPFNSSAGGLNH